MAISVTTTYPVNSTGTVPFSIMQNVNAIVCNIAATSDADTQAVISTNFSLPAADISAGWPTILIEPLTTGAALQIWTVQSIDPNYVGLLKNNTSNGGAAAASIRVVCARPHTIVR